MPTEAQLDNLATLRTQLYQQAIAALPPNALSDPNLPDILSRQIESQLQAILAGANGATPADGGLSDLIGLGATAPADIGGTQVSQGVVNYDEQIAADRILATADLYYIAIHELLGIWQVMFKLQELFRAGTLRIWNGPGALGLYRFDKHNILRYQLPERFRAYKRVFGYTNVSPGPNARSNPEFHGLFSHFIAETAKYWRDRRISEVIRQNANDPTFGSIAIVRRAGLDLRNNLKNSSYGYVSVLRNETSQALDEAFAVLSAQDLRAQFGAESAWDVVELVMWQYFHRAVQASTMNRMAVTGRDIIRWLAEPYVLETNRLAFETQLNQIAEASEEWISSEEGMRLTRPTPPARNVYMHGPPPLGGPRRDPVFARGSGLMPAPGLFR
jgi:hypothetical protein